MPRHEDIEVLSSKGLNISNLYALDISAGIILYIDDKGNTLAIHRVVKHKGICDTYFIDWNSVYEYGVPEDVYSSVISMGGEDIKEFIIKVLSNLSMKLGILSH